MKIIPKLLIITMLNHFLTSIILKSKKNILNQERELHSKHSRYSPKRKHRRHKRHHKRHHRKNYFKKFMALTKLQNKMKRNLFDLGGLAGAAAGAAGGGGGGGGSVKAGDVDIQFPPLPEALTAPININTPAAAYPQVVADPARQKPIVVVPELIYPHKVKRVIVHHNQSFHNYYSAMTHQMNPVYAKMAMMNPYYQDAIQGSQGFQSLMQSKPMSGMMSSLDSHFLKI